MPEPCVSQKGTPTIAHAKQEPIDITNNVTDQDYSRKIIVIRLVIEVYSPDKLDSLWLGSYNSCQYSAARK